VAEEDIAGVIGKWPSDWLTPSDDGASTSKAVEGSTVQTMATEKKKEA